MKHLTTFFQLFNHTGDGVLAVDANQRIIFWNRPAEQLLGYSVEEVRGRNCYELLAGRDLGDKPFCRFRCTICEQARAGQPIHTFNMRVTNNEGQSSWIDVSSIVVPDDSSVNDFEAVIHLFRLIDKNSCAVPPLSIRLLGPVTVQRADGSLVEGAFKQRAKVRALFSLLSLHRRQGIKRDYLLSTLWSDLSRKRGLRNLNTTVYYLRNSLEPGLEQGADSTYIQNHGERYLLLGSQNHWLDVDVFERKLVSARRAARTMKQERLYREAIQLYRADFLADLDADMLDCHTDRERYRLLHLEALQRFAEILLSKKMTDQAVDLFSKILTHDPYNISAVQHLMQLALDRGDRNLALSVYNKFNERLRNEMGIKPSRETQRIAERARQTRK
jgi:PAS domain S-box-containing protein